MTSNRGTYRQIVKSTSLFGGVQIFQILIQIVRSKFIAVILGPAGMGIASLLNSTTGLISGLTNFGLSTSAVRNVAEANESGLKDRIAVIVNTLKKLTWITGFLGMFITIILSPWLSQITFGNKEFVFSFIWVSVTLLFNQLCSGQLVILQGMRKLKSLAQANLLGSLIGLIITIPLYYIWKINAIVPGIIISSLISLLVSIAYSRKIEIVHVKLSIHDTFFEGKQMLIMGFLISLSGLITLVTSYVLRIFISKNGGLDQVGLFNSGFTIINVYVGMIFTAMSTEYYPRLSGIAHDVELRTKTINQQAEIALLILSPLICIFLIYINWVVILLYSIKFIPISEMIYWAAMGMFFKSISWPIGFLILAKGDSKVFLWSEIAANSYLLLFNIAGYKIYGLSGLGISFLAANLVLLIQVYLICRYRYKFKIEKELLRIFLILFTLASICFVFIRLLNGIILYSLGTLVIVFAIYISYRELDRRLDIKSILLSLKARFLGNSIQE
jgi:O-antigen/teichoic acid export membrane protein